MILAYSTQKKILQTPDLLGYEVSLLHVMVEPKGVEPLASAVQARRSSQLSYGPISCNCSGSCSDNQVPHYYNHFYHYTSWWAREDLNLRPLHYQCSALTS